VDDEAVQIVASNPGDYNGKAKEISEKADTSSHVTYCRRAETPGLGVELIALQLEGKQFGEARHPLTPDGAGDGIRTHDVLLGKQALYR
jgi:hypothetical protein